MFRLRGGLVVRIMNVVSLCIDALVEAVPLGHRRGASGMRM